jgi:DNA-directed RNA polymerase subunit RPC12/RpoP
VKPWWIRFLFSSGRARQRDTERDLRRKDELTEYFCMTCRHTGWSRIRVGCKKCGSKSLITTDERRERRVKAVKEALVRIAREFTEAVIVKQLEALPEIDPKGVPATQDPNGRNEAIGGRTDAPVEQRERVTSLEAARRVISWVSGEYWSNIDVRYGPRDTHLSVPSASADDDLRFWEVHPDKKITVEYRASETCVNIWKSVYGFMLQTHIRENTYYRIGSNDYLEISNEWPYIDDGPRPGS